MRESELRKLIEDVVEQIMADFIAKNPDQVIFRSTGEFDKDERVVDFLQSKVYGSKKGEWGRN